ncbi:MAG: UbiD family decarboxylase [Acidobacteria bacterium]|nr:UbiD family decarboxylase [Acidobacteriota bacterium]
MASKDLRTFIRELHQKRPDELKLVSQQVDPRLELTAIAEKSSQDGRYPGVFFTNVKGSSIPLVINLTATYERLALALGTSVQELVKAYGERQGHPVAPKITQEAPVHDVVLQGKEVDLYALPIPHHNETDSNFYVTSGVLICKDPESGRTNAGMYRHQVQARDQLGVWFYESHHGGVIWRRYEALGKPMEVAIAIGHHPAFALAAISRLPGIGGEFEEAGALLGEPLELTKARTVDLLVPARAEIVLEGVLYPRQRHREGPFGEWPGYTVEEGEKPCIKITTITMRKDALYYTIFPANEEHRVIGALPRMGSIYRRVREAIPGLVNVNVPAHARTHCYISIKKYQDSDVKKAAMTAILTEPENLRFVVVVDDDINVFNEREVMWAIGTRFNADKDLLMVKDWSGPGGLNPTGWEYHPDGSRTPIMSTVMLLDATMPLPPRQYPPLSRPPKELVERVDAARVLRDFDPSLLKVNLDSH